jgi:hypothetical protein
MTPLGFCEPLGQDFESSMIKVVIVVLQTMILDLAPSIDLLIMAIRLNKVTSLTSVLQNGAIVEESMDGFVYLMIHHHHFTWWMYVVGIFCN